MEQEESLKLLRNSYQDVIWQPLYHYRIFEPRNFVSELRFDFFHTPIGITDELTRQTLNRFDTNMYLAGSLPRGQSYYLTAIRFLIVVGWKSPHMDEILLQQDWQRISTTGVLEFRIGACRYLSDGPLCKFPTCFHTPQPFQNPKAEKRTLRDRLLARLFKQVRYEITPLYIESCQNFGVEVIMPALDGLSAPVRIGPILDGFLIRESQ